MGRTPSKSQGRHPEDISTDTVPVVVAVFSSPWPALASTTLWSTLAVGKPIGGSIWRKHLRQSSDGRCRLDGIGTGLAKMEVLGSSVRNGVRMRDFG